jgi:hypothetical protein
LSLPQIDPAEEQLQLGGTEGDELLAGLRPAVAADFEPLGTDPQTAGVAEEDLEQIAPAVGEDIELATQRVAVELMGDQGEQAIEAPAQIRGAGCQPDVRLTAEGKHRRLRSTQRRRQLAEPARIGADRCNHRAAGRTMDRDLVRQARRPGRINPNGCEPRRSTGGVAGSLAAPGGKRRLAQSHLAAELRRGLAAPREAGDQLRLLVRRPASACDH